MKSVNFFSYFFLSFEVEPLPVYWPLVGKSCSHYENYRRITDTLDMVGASCYHQINVTYISHI